MVACHVFWRLHHELLAFPPATPMHPSHCRCTKATIFERLNQEMPPNKYALPPLQISDPLPSEVNASIAVVEGEVYHG